MSFQYIAEDYEFPNPKVQLMGRGAFGIACQAKQKRTNNMVVIKRVSMRCYPALRYDTYLAKSVARELLNQRVCQGFPYAVKLLDWYRSQDGFDVYLVLEKWPYDMFNYISRLRSDHGLSGIDLDGSRVIMCQLLIALDFLHSRNIFHRDLSMGNVLVDPVAGNVCLADFGLSKFVPDPNNVPAGMDPVTEPTIAINIGTPQYKAPEALCDDGVTPSDPKWCAERDIWSLGCIFLEIVTGAPFMAEERDPASRLTAVLQAFRPMDLRSVAPLMQQRNCGAGWQGYFTSPRRETEINSSSSPRLSDRLSKVPSELQPIISKMLVLDPTQRSSASALLQETTFAQHPRCAHLIEEYRTKWDNAGNNPTVALDSAALAAFMQWDPISRILLRPRTADAEIAFEPNW